MTHYTAALQRRQAKCQACAALAGKLAAAERRLLMQDAQIKTLEASRAQAWKLAAWGGGRCAPGTRHRPKV